MSLGKPIVPFTFPANDGTVGQPLVAAGSRKLSWGTGYRLGGWTLLNTVGSGTYTTPSGCRALLVEAWGGGGAGGGAAGAASEVSVGGGGQAGGYAVKWITSPASSYSYTVGSGGTGVSGADGNDGGSTSFGTSLVTAIGGGGGKLLPSGTSVALANVGEIGLGGTFYGDLYTYGEDGGLGIRTASNTGKSGRGGSSRFGHGGPGSHTSGGDQNGWNGSGYASGGGGAVTKTAVNRTGGNGVGGLIIVWEYY